MAGFCVDGNEILFVINAGNFFTILSRRLCSVQLGHETFKIIQVDLVYWLRFSVFKNITMARILTDF
jgi:hypothetical protein